MSELSAYLDTLSKEYLKLHTKKEDLFWEAKMGLGSDPAESQRRESEAEIAVSTFIHDARHLQKLRSFDQSHASEEDRIALRGWKKFFEANVIEEPAAQFLAARIIEMEGELQVKRGNMGLGYIDPETGEKKPATSTVLRNMLISEKDELLRKAAYEALRTIGPFVLANGFIEIIKKRNELGKMCGFEDYYDYKVQKAEGISKKELFKLLDDLEEKTRDANKKAVDKFIKEKGESSSLPWNFHFVRSGHIVEKTDPYHPFSHAVERWARSFSAMNIRYRHAALTLDLIDRKGKYENGFMHGPVPSFFHHGTWNPARINFTANAIPNKIGSGHDALVTLFHEGGHAAHFSNVLMNAPCFGQEFAPTSVAYAETQSMFCDSVVGDADWLTKYARNDRNEPIPFELIEQAIRHEQPFRAMMIRGMLAVCYTEKALYEMSDDELAPENIQDVIEQIERRMSSLPRIPRPILAVPHLLAGESSAYYHGYVLAEMAVEQTRKYFFDKYGYIADNPHIGEELENGYWKYGNSEQFFDLVKQLTGKHFSADALIEEVNKTSEEVIADARTLLQHGHESPQNLPDLDADIKITHGNEKITEFVNGDFPQANIQFQEWVKEHYPKRSA